MKPVVLLTGDEGFDAQYGGAFFMLNMKYPELVREAGLIPVMAYDIRSAAEYAEFADGLFLTGGYDIHVGWYGQIYQSMDQAANVSVTRDDMEFTLCRLFLEKKKPVLAVGRGMEILNAALGGTVCRDVEAASFEKHTDGLVHPVFIKEKSRLSGILGQTGMVNSWHHQAVEQLGKGLTAAAVTKGGVIEAVEHSSLPVLGLAWHPERTEGENRKKSAAVCRMVFKEGWNEAVNSD